MKSQGQEGPVGVSNELSDNDGESQLSWPYDHGRHTAF